MREVSEEAKADAFFFFLDFGVIVCGARESLLPFWGAFRGSGIQLGLAVCKAYSLLLTLLLYCLLPQAEKS